MLAVNYSKPPFSQISQSLFKKTGAIMPLIFWQPFCKCT